MNLRGRILFWAAMAALFVTAVAVSGIQGGKEVATQQPDLSTMSAYVYADEDNTHHVAFAPEAGPNRITLVSQADGTQIISALEDAVVVFDQGACYSTGIIQPRNHEYRWVVLHAGQWLKFGSQYC